MMVYHVFERFTSMYSTYIHTCAARFFGVQILCIKDTTLGEIASSGVTDERILEYTLIEDIS